MGCDIHCYVERKNSDGNWQQETNFISDHYDKDSEYLSGGYFLNSISPIERRNYFLFSVLAGVRAKTKGVVPVSNPKGFPNDSCENTLKEYEKWEEDAHTASWLTVKELLEYNWSNTINCEDVVNFEQYKSFKINGIPDSRCGSTTRPRLSVCTNSDMDQYIEWGWDSDSYTVIKWGVEVSHYVQSFLNETLPQLIDRCKSIEKDDVRIVFWFDN